MASFVLVHGAWHDGSAWDQVARRLEAKGHRPFTPTIAGHGKGVNKRVNHADCTRSIVDFIVREGLNDFILVGHSFGGTIISKVAEAVPERIRRLVFVNGFVLRDGYSLVDEVPPATAAAFIEMAKDSPENTFLLPFQVWRETFTNDADLETAKRTYDALSPEPLQPCIDKLDLKKFYSLTLPRSYVALLTSSGKGSDATGDTN
jgi:pimeloyl-ACP methyl ester carboxylesterase